MTLVIVPQPYKDTQNDHKSDARGRYTSRFCIILLLLSTCTACSATSRIGDHAELSGTPAGIEKLSDLLNGMARTAKEDPKQSSEYFAHRHNQEVEQTKRFTFIEAK